MNELINLTPHNLNVVDADGEELETIEPSGDVARVEVTMERGGHVMGLPVYKAIYGDPVVVLSDGSEISLPEYSREHGHRYLIVSGMVEGEVNLPNVYAPGELKRDDDGRSVGCIGLKRT